MEYFDIFNKIGFFGFAFVILEFLIRRYYKKKDKKEEDNDICKKNVRNVEEKIENIIGVEKGYKEKMEEFQKTAIVMSNAIEALLRDRIIQAYNYYTDKECCPIYVRDSLEKMYKGYKELGGNGVVEGLVEELFNLPTEK